MSQKKLQDGFVGQKMWVIPRMTLAKWSTHPMLQSLIPTDIGWYPSAKYHYRERPQGAEEHILIFCTQGRGWYEINGERRIIEGNEVLLIPRGMAHNYGADDTTPWSIHWVHFVGNEADFYVYHLPIGEYKLSVEPLCAQTLTQLFTECYDSFVGGFLLYRFIYCAQVLHHLLGVLFFNNSSFSPVQRTSQFHSVEETLRFLHQNLHRVVSLGEMSDHAGLSTSHFSFLFKQQTGYSPMDYFIHLKMQRACTMLSFSQKTIHEIAYEIGYGDPYYFSRIFKKIIGVSPRNYRETQFG